MCLARYKIGLHFPAPRVQNSKERSRIFFKRHSLVLPPVHHENRWHFTNPFFL